MPAACLEASDLLRAVQAGLHEQTLEQTLQAVFAAGCEPVAAVEGAVAEAALPVVAPVPAPSPPAPPLPRRWRPGERFWRLLRRAGRRGLGLVRPLALPFLHRFEWRVRTAVDKSDFAVATRTHLQALHDRQTWTRDAVDRLHAAVMERAAGLMERIRAADGERDGQAGAIRQDGLLLRQITMLRFDTAEDKIDGLRADLARVEDRLGALQAAFGAAQAAQRESLDILLQRHIVPLAGGEYLLRSPAGWLVVPASDERLVVALIEGRGVLERGTTHVLTVLLRPGDTVLDVGAHIGTMTLPAARAVGPAGCVIAVEPGAVAMAMLRRSLHINGLAEIVVLRACAAGAEPGQALLHLPAVLGESSLLPLADSAADEAVQVLPLDALVPPGRAVALAKINVEGYELEVWRGMRRVLADSPDLAVIVEYGASHLRRAGTSPADWVRTFRDDGFTPWEIDETSGALRSLRTAGLEAVYSMNLLLLRRPPSAYPELVVA